MKSTAITRVASAFALIALLPVSDASRAVPLSRETTAQGLPLIPTRVLRFSVDEGTWISLDVSPDGATIVFDLLGQLYTLPIGGGTARAITSGMAFNAQPRFSPDGRFIVYLSDRDGATNIWVVTRDGGQQRQLTRFRAPHGDRLSSPVWSPDGKSIVASEELFDDRRRLIRIDVDTLAVSVLSEDAPGVRYLGPAFNPANGTLYASRQATGAGDTSWRLITISPMRGLRDLFGLGDVPGMRPVVSPDGEHMVYAVSTGSRTSLRIRSLSSQAERELVPLVDPDVSEWLYDSRDLVPGSAFTPDGRWLVTSFGGRMWQISVSSGAAEPIPFIVNVEQPAGPLLRFDHPIRDREFVARGIRNPAVSPDGTKIAFSALDRIWITAVDGTRSAVRLTQDEGHGEFFPTWSPDGRQIAYATWSDREGGAIFRATVGGRSIAERMTQDTAFYARVAYSRDGMHILAMRGISHPSADGFELPPSCGARLDQEAQRTGFEIVSIPASGGEPAPISPVHIPRILWHDLICVNGAPHTNRRSDIVFVPDEQGVVAISRSSGVRQRRLQVTGYDPRRDGAGSADQVLDAAVSPDGAHALVLMYSTRQPYLINMPPTSTAVPEVSIRTAITASNGLIVNQLSSTGADFIGWTNSGRPYYSAGDTVFLGDPIQPNTNSLPRFQQIRARLSIPRDRPQGEILLRGATLLTMRGSHTSPDVIPRGDILVRNGRIAALGPSGTIAHRPGTRILNVAGNYILPGYVDIHSHPWRGIPAGVYPSQVWPLATDLAYGVTALRNPGAGLDLMALGEREASGALLSPRIFTSAKTLTLAYGARLNGSAHDLGVMRNTISLWSRYYHSETLKVSLHGTADRRFRQLIAIAAREQRLSPTQHVQQVTSVPLTLAIDGFGGFEHLIPATPQYDDIIQLIVQSGIVQTPTIGTTTDGFRLLARRHQPWADPKMRRFVPAHRLRAYQTYYSQGAVPDEARIRLIAAQPARIMASGGCVGVGSHGDIVGIGVHFEMWLYALGGMRNDDVLRAATRCSAEAIGHGADFGSLEVGRFADLQILQRDPRVDIRNTLSIRYVMKNGRLYDADDLRELWPRSRPGPRVPS